jgi:CHAD domain-containing protein
MGDRFRETERKYDAVAELVVPALDGVPGVDVVDAPTTTVLEAVYFDTDDLRLAAAKITFRRRVGGADEGWHLKLPAGKDSREEIHSPLYPPPSGPEAVELTGAALEPEPGAAALAEAGRRAAELDGTPPTPAVTASVAPAPPTTGAASPPERASPAAASPAAAAGPDPGEPGALRAEPPAELVDLVRAIHRDAELGPVARLATTRRALVLRDAAGTELAEVVDDLVTAETFGAALSRTTWREIEVELGPGGDVGLLDKIEARLADAGAYRSASPSKLSRALAAGGRTIPAARTAAGPAGDAGPGRARRRAPAGEVVRAYLAAQVDALLATDPKVRLDEPDSVHRMRVATRRMRATLRTFRPLFEPAVADDLDNRLRDLAGALSGSRDLEVMTEYLTGRLANLPDQLVYGPVREAVRAALATDATAARAEALAALRTDGYLVLLADLEALVRGPLSPAAAGKAGTVLPALVRRADQRLARRIATALAEPAGHDQDEHLHAARKQAKRLRYAGEAVAPVFGPPAEAFATINQKVQDLLGEHQDAVITRDLLRQWGSRAAQGGEPTAFTLGVLLGLEDCRARTAIRDFVEYWPEASAKRHRHWLG